LGATRTLAGLMHLSSLWGRAPDNYLAAIHSFIDVVSLIPVACGFLWGLCIFGLREAIVVGFATATWAKLIYFAPHTLTEVVAGNLLPWALYLAYPDRHEVRPERLFAVALSYRTGYHRRGCLYLRIAGAAVDSASLWRINSI
jgi:hypothetical protein